MTKKQQQTKTSDLCNMFLLPTLQILQLGQYFPLNCHCETATVWLRLGIKSMLLGLGKDHAYG